MANSQGYGYDSTQQQWQADPANLSAASSYWAPPPAPMGQQTSGTLTQQQGWQNGGSYPGYDSYAQQNAYAYSASGGYDTTAASNHYNQNDYASPTSTNHQGNSQPSTSYSPSMQQQAQHTATPSGAFKTDRAPLPPYNERFKATPSKSQTGGNKWDRPPLVSQDAAFKAQQDSNKSPKEGSSRGWGPPPPHAEGFKRDRAPLPSQSEVFVSQKTQHAPHMPQPEQMDISTEYPSPLMTGGGRGRYDGGGGWMAGARGGTRGGARGGRGGWRGGGTGFNRPMDGGFRQRTLWSPRGPGNPKLRNTVAKIPSAPPRQLLRQKDLKGIVWTSKKSTGSDPIFTTTANYMKNQFTGTGRTKNDSINDASKYLLQALGETVAPYTEEKPAGTQALAELHAMLHSKKGVAKLEYTFSTSEPPFSCTCVFGGKTFSASGSTKKVAKASIAQRILDSITTNEIEISSTAANKIKQEATAALDKLNIRLGNSVTLDWNVTTVTRTRLTISGQEFIGEGDSKNAAKNSAALKILEAAKNGTLELPEAPKKGQKRSASDVASETENGQPVEKQKKATSPTVNPVTRVNKLFPGLTSWKFDEAGPSHEPMFTTSIVLQNRHFTGTATSKKEAKAEACQAILQAVEDKLLTPMKLVPVTSLVKGGAEASAATDGGQTPMQITTNTPNTQTDNPVSSVTRMLETISWDTELINAPPEPMRVVVKTTLSGKVYSGSAESEELAQAQARKNILAAIKSGDLVPQKADLGKLTCKLGQMWPRISWKCVQGGTVGTPTFAVSTVIEEVSFERVAGSKNAAKLECCTAILDAVEAGTLKAPERPQMQKKAFEIKRFRKRFGNHQIDVVDVGTEEEPKFNTSTTIDGKPFTGSGTTKDEALTAVIKIIDAALKAGEINLPIMLRFRQRFKAARILTNVIDGAGGKKIYTATFTHNEKVYSSTSLENLEKAEKDVAQQAVEAANTGI